MGKEAAAKAINEAKVSVAEQEKIGEIGRAEAQKETRIRTSEANAKAIAGENEAKVAIANSDALRREQEAEASRRAVAAEKVAQAKALEEAYSAEREAEMARAERERASQQANVIVAQEVEKKRWSSRQKPKPNRSACKRVVKLTLFLPRWKQRQRVFMRFSRVKLKVMTR